MRKLLYKRHKLIGNKGFSLVELIIVIAIMAVLMAVLAPQLIKYVEKSRTQADDTAASEILNAVKVALNDEAIYSHVVTNTHVTLVGGTGVIDNDANDTATITLPDGTTPTLHDYLQSEITAVVKSPVSLKSNTRKLQTYTITITIDATTKLPTAAIANNGWTTT